MIKYAREGEVPTARLRRAAHEAPMLDAQTEREYLERIREDDDPEAMHLLLASHLRLVLSIAQKYARHGVPLDDLIAEGNLGLVEAVRRYDFSKQTRFATYAAWWVRALVRRSALANRRIVGAPSTRNARRLLGTLRTTQRRLYAQLGGPPTAEDVASALGVTVEDVAMVEAALGARDVSLGAREDGSSLELPSGDRSPEDEAADREARALTSRMMDAVLAKLDARERTIVERRLLDEDAATLADIGRSMGISRERVRQLELALRVRLRGELAGLVA